MKLLESWNPNFAKTKLDRFCLGLFVFGIHLALWYEVFQVLSYYDFEETSTVNTHLIMAAIFYFGAISNLYKVVTTRTDCNLGVIDSNETREWPFCDRCCIYKPPRSHHCKRCNTCILMRDHHCWFAGCCIGHANYRYYMSLLLYMFSATMYANFFHYRFFMDHLGHLNEFLPICLVAPHFCAMLRFLTLYQLLVTIMTSLSFFCAAMFVWLLLIQMRQIIFGQTKYEHKNQIKDYNNGILNNLTTIMGRHWYVAWMFAWIPSPPPGNGATFPELVKRK